MNEKSILVTKIPITFHYDKAKDLTLTFNKDNKDNNIVSWVGSAGRIPITFHYDEAKDRTLTFNKDNTDNYTVSWVGSAGGLIPRTRGPYKILFLKSVWESDKLDFFLSLENHEPIAIKDKNNIMKSQSPVSENQFFYKLISKFDSSKTKGGKKRKKSHKKKSTNRKKYSKRI